MFPRLSLKIMGLLGFYRFHGFYKIRSFVRIISTKLAQENGVNPSVETV